VSRIYFHTRDEGEAEVLGSERAHMGLLISDVSAAFIPTFSERVLPFVTEGHYLHEAARSRRPYFEKDVRLALAHDSGACLLYNGTPVDSFALQLNTVLAVGNDPLKLLAMIHGQCEIHAYVEGPERDWLAGVIEQGREVGLYRANAGWEDVIKLLRGSADAPVVMSYSVCDSFPNASIADWSAPVDDDGEEDWDAWYELPDGDRWDLAMTGLRSRTDIKSLAPDRLGNRFAHELTLIDIFSQQSAGPRPTEGTG